MKLWQYRVETLHVHTAEHTLDFLGAQGWELVQVVPSVNAESQMAYLKRPAQAE